MKNNSTKSYGVAVSLCGVFGIGGIHHFYIGNHLHGIFDISLLIFGLYFLISGPVGLGLFLLLIDVIHTFFVFYRLITEKQKDGSGKLIVTSSGRDS
jgi:TM2 domain-containing membrane protein YozV